MKAKNFFWITIFAISGCTTAMTPVTKIESKRENVDSKNYTLEGTSSVYIGDAIIRRKSYETEVRTDLLEAQSDFILSGGMTGTSINLQAKKGDTFLIAGKNELGNDVVSIPNSLFMFGINDSGEWDKTVMSSSFWSSPVGSGKQYDMNPSNVKFEMVKSKTPVSEVGYINHEIIFTGIGSNGISLLYREYTFKDMSRSDFKQELIYPIDSKEIRFRKYKIKLLSVTPSEIKYSVLED